MSRRLHDTWPPLIVASEKPKWLWWRDLAITLVMWLLFAILLEDEFELLVAPHLEHIGWVEPDRDPDWLLFFERLRPYLYVKIALVASLAVAAMATVARYFRARR